MCEKVPRNRRASGSAVASSALIPGFVTHYHLADRRPFLNLSDLEETELQPVMAELARRRAASGLKRIFGRRYMEMRRLTEARLFELFVEAGGRPERRAPHYFCLGSCEWFRGLSPGMREVVVPLRDLPSKVTSFTYPDSFTSMGFGPQFGLPDSPQPYHGRTFDLSQLPELIARYGIPSGEPDEDYDGYHRRPFEKYVEIQLWSDEPIRLFPRDQADPGELGVGPPG